MSTIIKGKLVLKDLGDPKRALGSLEKIGDRELLGTIFGVAFGVNIRTMPNEEKYEGLKGQFEGCPADPAIPSIRSGICYLPEGMFEMIAAPFRGEHPVEQLEFVLEVYVQKDSNPSGYTWAFNSLKQPEAVDPINRMKSELEEQLKIAGPQQEVPLKAKGKKARARA